MKILVVGSGGTVGRALVPLLHEHDVVRFQGDIRDAEFVSADAVFLLWPFFTPDGADAVIDALATRTGHVVYLSSESATPASVWGEIEARIRATRLEWTFLRPTGFAKNTLIWADQIRSGVVRWPFGQAARSLIDERDLAAVAARALTERHAGATHVITGPEAVRQAEQVRLIGEAIGMPVRWEEQPRDAARDALVPVFGDATDAALDTWERFIAQPETVTDTVLTVTGRPAGSFRAWARDNADAF
ncbi:nucleoside-diphosphate sugar epimerase [Solirubrobacter sp. CPCC 204708]|uniref:NAD(P)H-binding protein n=1 Tax=Solirubrobacter deserti TaxID=2282478 RepID=A0ABT4RE34_9ACTN|nr:hypothetical protein [Solirubrobacter deserti]MBE2316042.1 nucleoside-diphosphate sugar epimerase [Solirubrobacter deserti]MDA0136794.1 hypothetical protein [Solirubrobacter deserti]